MKKTPNSHRVVEMIGPDLRMDDLAESVPANPLPVKCSRCGMPDLDHVDSPYLLARGFAAPSGTAPAQVGNFLVRDRMRRILELVVPGACRFVPTAEKRSGKRLTDWWLAVPVNVVDMPGLRDRDEEGERCAKCKAPALGYDFFNRRNRFIGLDHADYDELDIFKSRQWEALEVDEDDSGKHPNRWIRHDLDRRLFFSVRLEQLLKKARVKGQLVRYLDFEDVQPTEADLAWVDEKLAMLARHGLVDATGKTKPVNAGASRTSKWFQTYLRKNAAKAKPAGIDFAAIEKKHKLPLPPDYKDFLTTVGPKSFDDVMGEKGFVASILRPSEIDFRTFRRGKLKGVVLDEQSLAVDGVQFADTEHGDAFVFDAPRRGSLDTAADYPVLWYNHEGNTMEPFAPTFAECIKRFAERI